MSRTKMEKALKNCEFFNRLEKNEISKIAGLCQISTYESGEYVFRQGDVGEHLYIIAEGHVTLERSVDLGVRKGSVPIETLGKGRVLGCWSTLLGEPHTILSSATCQKQTTVVSIKGSDLRQMMMGNSEMGFNILERLCFLLRDRIQAAYGAMERI